MRFGLVVSALVGMLAGCSSPECDVGLDDLSMVAIVRDDGSTVRAEVDFATGDRGILPEPWRRCEGRDEVLINGESALERDREGGRVEYSRTVGTDDAPREFEFELNLGERSVRASVELPEAFTIVEPAFDASLSTDEETSIAWEPGGSDPGAQMQVELEEELGGGFCLVTEDPDHPYKRRGGLRVDDEGRWVVPGGVVTAPDGRRCTAWWQLSRFSRGSYPDGLRSGGFVEARVVREQRVTIGP